VRKRSLIIPLGLIAPWVLDAILEIEPIGLETLVILACYAALLIPLQTSARYSRWLFGEDVVDEAE